MAQEYVNGCVAGMVGQLMCHPFDTIKTHYQRYGTFNFQQNNGFRGLYRGLVSPLTSVIIEKSILFGSYDLLKQHLGNGFSAGVAAGLMTTLTVVPFERIKVLVQLNHNNNSSGSFKMLKYVIKNDGMMSLYRGWTPTLFREVPGYGLYFTTYETIKRYKNYQPLHGYEAFLTGSMCGSIAWLFIYPSDPVKTMMQKDNVGLLSAISKIYTTNGIKGFYRGFSWGIMRACILHGGVFFGYETFKNFKSS